jgi:hypothetical protein
MRKNWIKINSKESKIKFNRMQRKYFKRNKNKLRNKKNEKIKLKGKSWNYKNSL